MMMFKEDPAEFTEEDLTANASMLCKQCGASDFENGKVHNSGKPTQDRDAKDRWLRLFKCKNCKMESAL